MSEEKLNKPSTTFVVVIILCIIVIIGLVIFNLSNNDKNKEYSSPYSKDCYKVENDSNSITITKYYNNTNKENSIIMEEEKYLFENGQVTYEIHNTYYKTKAEAKNDYDSISDDTKSYYETLKLDGNCIERKNLFDEINYESEEVKQKMKSFTTNEETINYIYELNENRNYNLPNNWEKL